MDGEITNNDHALFSYAYPMVCSVSNRMGAALQLTTIVVHILLSGNNYEMACIGQNAVTTTQTIMLPVKAVVGPGNSFMLVCCLMGVNARRLPNLFSNHNAFTKSVEANKRLIFCGIDRRLMCQEAIDWYRKSIQRISQVTFPDVCCLTPCCVIHIGICPT